MCGLEQACNQQDGNKMTPHSFFFTLLFVEILQHRNQEKQISEGFLTKETTATMVGRTDERERGSHTFRYYMKPKSEKRPTETPPTESCVSNSDFERLSHNSILWSLFLLLRSDALSFLNGAMIGQGTLQHVEVRLVMDHCPVPARCMGASESRNRSKYDDGVNGKMLRALILIESDICGHYRSQELRFSKGTKQKRHSILCLVTFPVFRNQKLKRCR